MKPKRLGNAEWISPAVFREKYPYEDGTFWLGRDPETGDALGYVDDRHIMLCSGTRAGKGTTTLIPNLCLWPGSVVVVDPKGENASVTAARRGNGSDFCEGMGQKVVVIDPFLASSVDDAYRGSYNPFDELDPNDEDVNIKAGQIADAIVVELEGVKDPFWQTQARAMVKFIILHVLTWPLYEGRRNLVTVRELISRGDIEGLRMAEAAGTETMADGHQMLWGAMAHNEAVNGNIAGFGERMRRITLGSDSRLFDSMLTTVDRETEWIDAEKIKRCMTSSTLRLSELKSDTNGVSLYLCLPEGYVAEHSRWLRMMLTLTIHTFEATEKPDGYQHRCLMVIDEFLGLERTKAVQRAVSYTAGFGLTMLFVVQGFTELDQKYGKSWENIVGNCGLKIFFAVDEPFAREYISKMIGETEVRVSLAGSSHAEGTNNSTSKSVSENVTESKHTGRSESHTDSTSSSTSEGRTESTSESFQRSVGSSDTSGTSVNKGTSEGVTDTLTSGTSDTRGRSHTEGQGSSETAGWSPRTLLFRDTDRWTHLLRENETASMGTNRSASDTTSSSSTRNVSKARALSRSQNESYGQSASHTDNVSESTGYGTSLSYSSNRSETVGSSDTVTTTAGESTAISRGTQEGTTEGTHSSDSTSTSENAQARRLISAEDIGAYFDRPDEGQVGFGLVMIGGKRPTVVARTAYYDDPYFVCWFDPHPSHAPPPKKLVTHRLALPAAERDVHGTVVYRKQPGEPVEAGEEIAALTEIGFDNADLPDDHNARLLASHEFNVDHPYHAELPVRSPFNGEFMGLISPDPERSRYASDGKHHNGDHFAEIKTNRRELLLGGESPDGSFDRLSRYFDAARKLHEDELFLERSLERSRLEKVKRDAETLATAARERVAEIQSNIDRLEKETASRRTANEETHEQFMKWGERGFIEDHAGVKAAWNFLTYAIVAMCFTVLGGSVVFALTESIGAAVGLGIVAIPVFFIFLVTFVRRPLLARQRRAAKEEWDSKPIDKQWEFAYQRQNRDTSYFNERHAYAEEHKQEIAEQKERLQLARVDLSAKQAAVDAARKAIHPNERPWLR
ncbi:MAG: type IV secretory system conjugative DNA transfer family protein [Planctomycetota bacterium]